MTYTPRIFIGSSTAGKTVAAALESLLTPQMTCRLWFKDTFSASRTTIESLEGIARSEVDVAVLVLTPDDLRDRGDGAAEVARDNIVFELGLFMGALGRGRTFGLKCEHCAIEMPSDLHGVTWIHYRHPHDTDHSTDAVEVLQRVRVALAPAASEIVGLVAGLKPEPVRAVGSPEIVKAYPMRGLVSRVEWNNIIRGSVDQLWLYGMAEMGYAEDDEVPGILAAAARAGCQVRVMLLDPRYPGIDDIDADEGSPRGTLAARVKAGLSRFSRMRAAIGSGMQIRVYRSAPMVSIVRGDHRMLVTPYVRFLAGDNTPTLELRESEPRGMFYRYSWHFEGVWRRAEEWPE